ncbi:glutathione S-transferase [Colletotrichum truncatum]|uniref:Glutathione S-transferase n=1 Tax=Colletotrichum truncatum TaxID=5467 RepID=A0ACC3YQB2_COLTU|nr:glutathione S-transferase [Colletotrichum truncatum]KAF6796696.1 glutathione S-transferase [Colletotrichum truncatum]
MSLSAARGLRLSQLAHRGRLSPQLPKLLAASQHRDVNLVRPTARITARPSTARGFASGTSSPARATTKDQPKIKLYWLNDSRAQNTLWLLEELGLKYSVQVFHRDATRLAPPELAQVHPLGKAPVLEITPAAAGAAPIRLAESGHITQYLLEHFGRNKPSLIPEKWRDGHEGEVGGETEAYARFSYLMHYVEGSFFANLSQYLLVNVLKSSNVPFLIRPITGTVADKINSIVFLPNSQKHLSFLENYLKTAPGVQNADGYLCGPELSAADILISFGLATADGLNAFDKMGPWEGGSARAAHPVVFAYLDRLKKQPGYIRASEKAKEMERK